MNAYGHRYRVIRKQMVAAAQVCAICGNALDKLGDPRGPWAPSVDHMLPVKATRGLDDDTRARLLNDRQRLRVVHLRCNASRGAGRERTRHISRSW